MKKMKIKITIVLIGIVFLCSFGLAQDFTVSVLPVDQIEAGMKGKGKTFLQDDEFEEFDVEILGILHNWQPQRNLILAKLQSDVLERAGVVRGMSGSPVYIDGKLIGAVSYSLGTFSKEAIAGITPIEEMMAIPDRTSPKSSFAPRMQIKNFITSEDFHEMSKAYYPPKTSSIDGRLIKPLSIPLLFSGFSSHVFDKAKPFFSRLGFSPIQSGSSGQIQPKISPSQMSLQAGEPVAVQLIKGDLDMSAVGTVTHVEGNKVLAFGHPFYNLGAVDFAMTKAKIMAVLPSLETSFVLSASDRTVGRFVQDRNSGVFGELGKLPRYIPINANLLTADGETREFKVQIADDKLFTPLLVNLVVSSIVLSEERNLGDLSLELRGTVYLDDAPPVQLQDLFSGNLDMAATDLSGLVAAVVFYLTNNEFKELGIYKIDLNIGVAEEVRFATLEKIWLGKYEAKPGEIIPMKVFYRNFRGETIVDDLSLPTPNLPSGSEFNLIVGDAASIQSIEISQYRTTGFLPRSLYQLIRLLNSLRKRNYIYFKIIAAKPGLFLRGEEMPNLPPTMKSMFSSPRAASTPPVKITQSTLGEYRHSIPYVFSGLAMIPLKIK
jgi:hypothetical protein